MLGLGAGVEAQVDPQKIGTTSVLRTFVTEVPMAGAEEVQVTLEQTLVLNAKELPALVSESANAARARSVCR